MLWAVYCYVKDLGNWIWMRIWVRIWMQRRWAAVLYFLDTHIVRYILLQILSHDSEIPDNVTSLFLSRIVAHLIPQPTRP